VGEVDRRLGSGDLPNPERVRPAMRQPVDHRPDQAATVTLLERPGYAAHSETLISGGARLWFVGR
jgi:hypothetical protein